MARALSRYTTAVLLVLLGGFLLLFTTGVIDDVSFWAWVPGIFVLLGAWALIASRGRNLTGPVLVIVIAGASLLQNLDYLPPDFIGTWWPAIFVLLGVLVVVGRSRRRRWGRVRVEGTDELTVVSIFGGSDRSVRSEHFAGGDVVAIFGGPDIDLRDASVADPPAVLEVVSVFGGADIRVPEDWTVDVQSVPIFGGVSDKRRRAARSAETADATGERRPPDLVLTGVSVFGGVEITD